MGDLEALVSLSSALRQALTLQDVVRVLLEVAVHALGAQTGTVLMLHDGALVAAGLCGLPEALLGRRHLPCDDFLWQVVTTGQPTALDLAKHGEVAASEMLQILASGMTSLAVVPLQAAQEALGLLELGFTQPHPFETYCRPLVAVAEIGSNAVQRVQVMDALERLVRDRTRDLAALYEVTTMTTQPLDTRVILERVLDKALEVVGGEAGTIHLLDEASEALRLTITCGLPSGSLDWLHTGLLDDICWGKVLAKKETVIVPDWPSCLPAFPHVQLESVPAYIGVPIYAAGRVLGVLSVFGETIQDFSAEDVALLAAIANHVGAAVEGARLRQRTEEAAVMEERQRLARELHDSVTQSLYSLTLFAEAAQDSIAAADLGQARHYLSRLGETGRQALKEMRLLIYQLHPLALTQEGLVGSLQRRLEVVERRAGVQAQVLLEAPLPMTPRVEAGLYGIAQEALNNVLKHAHATRVTVRLGAVEDDLLLEVADNGLGFDLESVRDRAGLGLASIKERAQELGGSVQVSSSPEAGTTIKVLVPCKGQDSDHLTEVIP
jgi:signal transduction histidine kinase